MTTGIGYDIGRIRKNICILINPYVQVFDKIDITTSEPENACKSKGDKIYYKMVQNQKLSNPLTKAK